MKAGDLRHRVTFQAAIDTEDTATGERMRSWDDANEVIAWAAVEPIRGQEGDVANGIESSQQVRIRTRHSSALAAMRPKDRALWGASYYNIEDVRNVDTRGRELHFYCTTGLNDGR